MGARFRRDSDEEVCFKVFKDHYGNVGCMRRKGHKGRHIGLACAAASADAVCHDCRAPIDKPHKLDCYAYVEYCYVEDTESTKTKAHIYMSDVASFAWWHVTDLGKLGTATWHWVVDGDNDIWLIETADGRVFNTDHFKVG